MKCDFKVVQINKHRKKEDFPLLFTLKILKIKTRFPR